MLHDELLKKLSSRQRCSNKSQQIVSGRADLRKRTAAFGKSLPQETSPSKKWDDRRRPFAARPELLEALPSREWIGPQGLCVALAERDKQLLSAALRRVEKAESLRRASGVVGAEWKRLCRRHSDLPQHRAPRWTFPLFYFRQPLAALFTGKDGLDVGARTSRPNESLRGLRSVVTSGRRADDLTERFLPHFRYYETFGSRMRAIDLLGTRAARIDRGDARLLPYADASFDFITAAMLLGPPHSCASPLDIAFSLGEFRRVLRPGGFALLADAGVQPSVLFTAERLGLSAFVSKGDVEGFPVGTLLRRGDLDAIPDNDGMFSSPGLTQFHLAPNGFEIVVAANLLWDSARPQLASTEQSISR